MSVTLCLLRILSFLIQTHWETPSTAYTIAQIDRCLTLSLFQYEVYNEMPSVITPTNSDLRLSSLKTTVFSSKIHHLPRNFNEKTLRSFSNTLTRCLTRLWRTISIFVYGRIWINNLKLTPYERSLTLAHGCHKIYRNTYSRFTRYDSRYMKCVTWHEFCKTSVDFSTRESIHIGMYFVTRLLQQIGVITKKE